MDFTELITKRESIRSYDPLRPVSEETLKRILDAAIAITHIILAAENEGVGACWIANYDPVKLREALGIGGDQEIFGITPIGYPRSDFRKSGIKKRKSFAEVIEFI